MSPPSQDAAIELGRAGTPGRRARASSSPRRWLSPTKLAYLIGPLALAVVLVLTRFGYVARVSPWVWVGLFVGIAVVNWAADRFYDAHPGALSRDLRVISQAASVTVAIYLTGWGPVLWPAYFFIALENLARAGSRVWRTMVLCSFVGMG